MKLLDLAKSLFGPPKLKVVAVSDLEPWRAGVDNGSKFAGGFGATDILTTDFWTLRARSIQLFETNLYARGLLRRLVTNEINVGLHLEATPEELILGREEDSLADWSEDVENRFELWAKNPAICDQNERLTFGALQAAARLEAMIAGDVLVVMRQDPRTKLPRIQLISGELVQTPLHMAFGANGVRVVHGVELDAQDRHIAFWVRQRDGSSKRLPAFGEKSGRRLAWLVYGSDRRLNAVRGKPMLALILQSLKEIDRYRDAALRKAVVNSMYAAFVKKTEAKAGTKAFAGGATKKGAAAVATGDTSTPRTFNFVEQIPGAVIQELQVGEEPVPYSNAGTDVKFGEFEEAMVQAFAWQNNVPPEILKLAFSSNYSASQAAINEFKMYLNVARTEWGESFCQPIYTEWLLASVIGQKIEAPGLFEAFRDFTQHDTFSAWVSADWSGHIKPAVDLTKQGVGYSTLAENGFITRDRASRETTGTKFSKNVKKLARENQQLADALRPLAELEASKKPEPAPPPSTKSDDPDEEEDEVDEADRDEDAAEERAMN